MEKRVSTAVIRRLPKYLRHLNDLSTSGVERISSGALASQMGLTASQVRQDFNCFGGFGQQGYGYNVEALKSSIASILKIDNEHKAILIGAGNLGRALMKSFNFAKSGFELIAAFDADGNVAGTTVSGVPVYHISKLEEFVAAEKPDIGVLTLPKAYARDVALTLCQSGIKGIWNFTSVDLHLDFQHVPVENVHFSESLMVLSYKI